MREHKDKEFSRVALEVQNDWQMGGFAKTIYEDYAHAIYKKMKDQTLNSISEKIKEYFSGENIHLNAIETDILQIIKKERDR